MSESGVLYMELWRRVELVLGKGSLSPHAPFGRETIIVGIFTISALRIAWESDPRFTIIREEREVILDQIGGSTVDDWTTIEVSVLPELRRLTILEDLADV